MSAHTYRVGLVGSGGIARAHGNACKAVDCAELSAICDVSEEALNRYGEEFGVANRYLDLDEMLQTENLDIAIICNWGAYHAETGIQISKSRQVKAILCEKPFTSTAAEAEQMVAAARENGILLAEAFKFRHHPMHLKAKELVDAGAIGEVMTVRSTFCSGGGGGGPETRKPEANWRFNKAKGGGSIYDLGCYCIHHARFIFGTEPVRVFAASQPGLEVEDAAYLLLVFPNDRTAQISVGFNAAGGQYAEICGRAGMIRMDKVWNNENQPVTLEHHSQGGVESINFESTFQFAHQLRHLCDCLQTGGPHRIPPENSINQMRVIDAVFESMATGKAVEI
ncbi:MAG: Gfo/Idh/MocA family oxidoreductase [Candidatus Poribacteria bacterium]|nr:Gfo/Idh/MocA family oxidoreductase [Candidatus Poribacteria bacterium]